MEEPVLPNIIRTPGFVRPLSIPPDIRQFEKVTMPDRYCEVAQCQAQMLSFGLQTDPIIDGISEPLFAAEVSLRRLNALMAEQKLDLLNLAAGVVTQAGASAPKVVWSDTGQTTSTASEASYASRRTAANRRLIVEAA